MTDARGAAMIARLDAAEARLTALAAMPMPAGRTEPAPGGEETWSAAQVWAHLSEFPAFWTDAARRVLAAPPEAPASFGRTLTDDSRLGPIAAAADVPVDVQLRRCVDGIGQARTLLVKLRDGDWERVGVHIVRGEVTVATILEAFVVAHLEEHAAQLERLAAAG